MYEIPVGYLLAHMKYHISQGCIKHNVSNLEYKKGYGYGRYYTGMWATKAAGSGLLYYGVIMRLSYPVGPQWM